MKVVVIPNELHDAIHAKITEALKGRLMAEDEREVHYQQLLEYYDINGVIPEFELKDEHGTPGKD